MELVKLSLRAHYIPGAVNVGVVITSPNHAVLIDSGLDDDGARKILKLLEEHKLKAIAIINTHSHADHCGGNGLIKERTGAKVYAPQMEAGFIEHTKLEPTYLFSGAEPIPELCGKFLIARPSSVDHKYSENDVLTIDGVEFATIPLLGHSPQHSGICVDNVLYCGDSIFSIELLEKHKIPFAIDIENVRKTLEFLRDSTYDYYVPAHAAATSSADISELAEKNISASIRIEEELLKILSVEKTSEQALQCICDNLQITLKNPQQYYLMNTAVLAYLSYLRASKKASVEIKDNAILWKATRG